MAQTRVERNAKQKAKYWANHSLSLINEKMKYQRKLKRLDEVKATTICFDSENVQQALTMWGR